MNTLTLAGASLVAKCFVLVQWVLPTRALSRCVHSLTRVRWVPFKNGLIHLFMRAFNISLVEAEIERANDFEHFNAFFTRALKPGERPLAPMPAFLSPVDGRVSQRGALHQGQLVQAKGHRYSAEALLGDRDWAQTFTGGDFATIYLAPYNYHRIHMPIAGRLRAWRYIPGRLFSVNGMTASAMPDLFSRNTARWPWPWWARCLSAGWKPCGAAWSHRPTAGVRPAPSSPRGRRCTLPAAPRWVASTWARPSSSSPPRACCDPWAATLPTAAPSAWASPLACLRDACRSMATDDPGPTPARRHAAAFLPA